MLHWATGYSVVAGEREGWLPGQGGTEAEVGPFGCSLRWGNPSSMCTALPVPPAGAQRAPDAIDLIIDQNRIGLDSLFFPSD